MSDNSNGTDSNGSDDTQRGSHPHRPGEDVKRPESVVAEPGSAFPLPRHGTSDSQDAHGPEDRSDGEDRGGEVRDEDEGRSDDEGRDDEGHDDADERDDEEQRQAAEEFAKEHDPADHDIEAGSDFRQRGDWTADEAGGAQVWDSEGNLVEGSDPGTITPSDAHEGSASEHGSGEPGSSEPGSDEGAGGRRTSSLDEVRDGGYSVGSAAPIEDGAMPLGHPVKAWNDTKTYKAQGHPGYDDAEPEVWFTDERAAQRAGFNPAE